MLWNNFFFCVKDPPGLSGGVHANAYSGTKVILHVSNAMVLIDVWGVILQIVEGERSCQSLQAAVQEAMKGAFRPGSVNGLDETTAPKQLFRPQFAGSLMLCCRTLGSKTDLCLAS